LTDKILEPLKFHSSALVSTQRCCHDVELLVFYSWLHENNRNRECKSRV